MKIIHMLRAVMAHVFYRWAQQEISPTHPDVAKVMHRELYWREQRAALGHPYRQQATTPSGYAPKRRQRPSSPTRGCPWTDPQGRYWGPL